MGDIIKYIAENKEWTFPAIGAIFIAITAALVKFIRKSDSNKGSKAPTINKFYINNNQNQNRNGYSRGSNRYNRQYKKPFTKKPNSSNKKKNEYSGRLKKQNNNNQNPVYYSKNKSTYNQQKTTYSATGARETIKK